MTTWQDIRRSLKRLRRRHAEEIVAEVQRYLRNGADPHDVRSVTGIPLRLIDRIGTDHAHAVDDVAAWQGKQRVS